MSLHLGVQGDLSNILWPLLPMNELSSVFPSGFIQVKNSFLMQSYKVLIPWLVYLMLQALLLLLNLIDVLQDTSTNPDSHQDSNAPTVPGVPGARLLSGLGSS